MSDNQSDIKVPCEKTMKYLAKLSIVNDKPIMMDYWVITQKY